MRRIGYAVLALQLAGFCAWSLTMYDRFAMTFDFAVYHQAWYLIAHGNLDPFSSISRVPFWRNDAEVAVWPIAPLYWIWPHDVVLLWVQDLGVVAAEMIAFSWLCEIAERRGAGRSPGWLAGTGLVLLAANPWIWWAISFDFHEEALAIPFAVLLARDLAAGRRRAWAWVAPILAAGAPTTTYLIGIGLGGALAGRRARLPGLALIGVGVAYSALIVLVHGDAGVPLTRHYGYLATGAMSAYAGAKLTTGAMIKGIAAHPMNLLRTLWAKRADLVANVAPAGLLGIGWIEVLPLVAVVLLANVLSYGLRFAEPLFQSLPVYLLVPVGTVAVLARLSARSRKVALSLAAVLVVQAAGWLAIWGPQTSPHWLRIPPATSATLAAIAARIPASAEVIASQGVVGRFSGRTAVHELAGRGTTPITARQTWFVVTPYAGAELQTTASALGMIDELAGPLHATLVTQAHGVWAFRLPARPGLRTIHIPGDYSAEPAWAAPLTPGAVGRPVLSGPLTSWHLTSSGLPGYVADGLSWLVPAGHYQVRLTLSATSPVEVEVWNDNGDVLLARRGIPATAGTESVLLPVAATRAYPATSYTGWGPFQADFVPPPAGQLLEVRVWTGGTGTVNIYRAELTS